MHCEERAELRSHNTSYFLIEVVTKAGLTISHVTLTRYNSILNVIEFTSRSRTKTKNVESSFKHLELLTQSGLGMVCKQGSYHYFYSWNYASYYPLTIESHELICSLISIEI